MYPLCKSSGLITLPSDYPRPSMQSPDPFAPDILTAIAPPDKTETTRS